MIVTFLLLGGLVYPKIAMWIGFIHVVARFIYTFSYVKYGANSRVVGAVAGGLPLYILGIATLVKLGRTSF